MIAGLQMTPRYFADKENTEELITTVLLRQHPPKKTQKKTKARLPFVDLQISTNVGFF